MTLSLAAFTMDSEVLVPVEEGGDAVIAKEEQEERSPSPRCSPVVMAEGEEHQGWSQAAPELIQNAPRLEMCGNFLKPQNMGSTE